MAIDNEDQVRREAERKVMEFQQRAQADLAGAEMVDRATRDMRIGLLLVLLVTLLAFVVIVIKDFVSQRQMHAQQASRAAASRPVGQAGVDYLFRPGELYTPLASDEQALDAVSKALDNRDMAALDRLRRSGRIFEVSNGTRVQHLESAYGQQRVRVAHGNLAGRTGWVLGDWLRPVRPTIQARLTADPLLMHQIPVATDAKGLATIAAAPTQDDMKLAIFDLAGAHRLYYADIDTPVKILQAGHDRVEVQLPDGRRGWVFPAWVKP